jgi:hypothetical protein
VAGARDPQELSQFPLKAVRKRGENDVAGWEIPEVNGDFHRRIIY